MQNNKKYLNMFMCASHLKLFFGLSPIFFKLFLLLYYNQGIYLTNIKNVIYN